jgi:mono/diheme cytochrome c family protein
VDGRAEPVWDGVEPLSLPLRGTGESGERKAVLKALAAGDTLYFLARWPAGKEEPAGRLWEKAGGGEWKPVPPELVRVIEHGGQRTAEWSRPSSAVGGLPALGERERALGLAAADERRERVVFQAEALRLRLAGDVLPPDRERLARGERTYQSLCARCHTLDGSEIYPNAKSFQGLNRRADDRVIWENIRFGFANVSGQSEEQLQDLFAYLRSLE